MTRSDVVTYNDVAAWIEPDVLVEIEKLTGLDGIQHGTVAGAQQHVRGQSGVCRDCREARVAAQAGRRV